MRINVTQEQIAACIKANEEALVHHIRDCGRSHPPADGTIGRIVANLDALRGLAPLDAVVIVADEVDVGATEKGERVTVKRKIAEGRGK